ncbi:MAG TPA: radical SAM/SPASM domain-containing protein [bacterium]|nr:radical SAM/SPASM domain-containing protein [bacterium]HPR86643.1 radical SAM/SPASM domain-containing protein [bacterium]
MKELPWSRLIAAGTPGRALHAGQALAAAAVSRLTGKPHAGQAPYVLSIEPTNLCDLHCRHCETGAGLLRRPTGMMDLGLYRRLLKMNRGHLLYLLLYGQGEPLLHPDFPEMVRLAKSQRICVASSSNGQRLADPDLARAVAASGLDSLILSADALTPEHYAQSRRGGTLENVRTSLRHLRQARQALGQKNPRLLVQFVITRQNEAELPEMTATARSWGADRVLLKSLYLHDPARAEEFLPADPHFRRYQQQQGRWAARTRRRCPCPRLAYSCVIQWDGNVIPCCFDKDGTHVLGHASAPLAELFRGPAFTAFRRQQISAKAPHICQNCSDGLNLYPA